MKTFYISIKFNVVFHFNMLQQLHLPVNSIICKMRKYQLKLFNLFKELITISTQFLNLRLRKLD